MVAMSHNDAGDASETLDRQLGSVGDAMRADVLVLTPETPGDVAARRLERAGVSGAPVVRHGRVVGVVTLRDGEHTGNLGGRGVRGDARV